MFRSHFLTLAALLALSYSLTLAPSTQAQAPSGADAPQTVTAPYRLGPGDVISIEVTNFPELSTSQITIPLDGKISAQFVDSLPVAGMTVTELAQALTQRWSEYVVKPSVTVTLVQKREEHGVISILGAVRTPGRYPIKDTMTVLDALQAAGGPRDDADLANVQLLHDDGKRSVLDLRGLLNRSGLPNTIMLLPGDLLLIPVSDNRDRVFMFIGDDATIPIPYFYKAGERISDALKASGAVITDLDLTKVRLIHYDKSKDILNTQTVNMNRFYSQGDLSVNPLLSPDDVLVIPPKDLPLKHPRPIGDFGGNGKPLFLGR